MSTPMSIVVSTGVAARMGVLVRNGEALENLSRVTHVVFDKTGTLTEGHLRISRIQVCDDALDEAQLLGLAGSLERNFTHPLARAIVKEAEDRGLGFASAEQLQANSGLGVVGRIAGKQLWLGNARLMTQAGLTIPSDVQHSLRVTGSALGVAVMLCERDKLLGVIYLEDRLREGARELLDRLRGQGMGITLLTGDTNRAAHHLQAQLGVMRVVAELLPEDKAREIEALQQKGERVLMVGDGVNDAPALARADVSIAMESGTDVSMECSDVVLMGSDLRKLPYAIEIGRQALRTIRQNLTLSLAYNVILIPVAMAAWVTPIFAAIAMPISSLLVIGNAILIRRRMGRFVATQISLDMTHAKSVGGSAFPVGNGNRKGAKFQQNKPPLTPRRAI
jgi:Cu2+-exporting ATPase